MASKENRRDVEEKLIEVINEIGRDCQYEWIDITPNTCPMTDLENFDSQLGIEVIVALEQVLDGRIPADTNIFVDDDGRPLEIDEVVDKVWRVIGTGELTDGR